MSTTQFSTASNDAYLAQGVLPADQRWFAFDVRMPEARKREATRFAMTIWNFRENEQKGEVNAIREDSSSGEHWYRVPRTDVAGITSKNRASLWEGVSIARKDNLPMLAILKDRTTKRCSLDHVFEITDVVYEADASALWLQLDTQGRELGTEAHVTSLAHLDALFGDDPDSQDSHEANGRMRKLSSEQYMAACEVARDVYFGTLTRQAGLAQLKAEQQMTEGTASALINNFRCLMTGTPIKAPMSVDGMEHFTDAILALEGDGALGGVILALNGFVQYSKSQWGSDALGMQRILARLQKEEADLPLGKSMDKAVDEFCGAMDARSAPNDQVTEILKEIWVRGPQHAAFRRALLRRWNGVCSVHGVACNDHLRASHIVAWRLDKAIRGDVDNGLLLSVPLDSLFDRGLISFSSNGEILFSKKLAKETKKHFGLHPELRLAWSHLPDVAKDRVRRNLVRHRETYSAQHGYL